METYKEKQRKLFEKLEAQFKENSNAVEIVEPVSDYVSDNRICLTSVVFPPKYIVDAINKKIVSKFVGVDDNQYFFLPESFHLTIQNIRTINLPPLFNDEDIKKARDVFRKIIPRHNQFSFKLSGLFETPTSFSIRGYCNDNLQKLILDLRTEMISAGVPDNKKYGSEDVFFGNITVCRFTKKPNEKFYQKIKELKNIEIGNILVDKVSLITTNAVAHPSKTKIIEEFYLNKI